MISDSDDSASTSTVDLQPLRELFQQCDLNLSQQKVESIIEKFVTLGIENIDDLKLLTESDLLPILPLIKCRKLLNYVNKAVESAVQDASISATLTPIPNTVNDSTSHDGSTKVTMPWQRFSKSLKDCLEKNEIPTPAQRREIVRILGDELLEKCRSPNRTDVRRLAKLVVQSYPKAFEDKSLGGTKIQDGSASLTIQLENRLYNLKRDSTETIEVANNEAEDSEAVPRKRKQRISQYGCVQLSLKDVTSDMELESCKRKLQEMFENQETDSTAIQEMYQNCFTNICNIIHSQKHSITTLKGDWPILFTFAGLKIHYQLLTDRNLDNFSQSICQSRGNVLQCMQLFQHGNKALQVVLKRVYQAKELTGSNQCEIIGILHLLCAYFKEDIAFLYQIVSFERLMVSGAARNES